MMGPSHAVSGAAVWLTGSWAAAQFFDYGQSATTIAIGAAVCAGGALLPDMDVAGKVTTGRGGSTVARSFGVVTLFIAEILEKVSLGIYHATKLSGDPQNRQSGHRTFTHTLPFCLLMGFGAVWLCTRYGKWAVMGVLFFLFGLALRGLFNEWAKKAGWVIVTITSGAAAYFAFEFLPEERGFPMIGVAVGVGCFVHLMGDIITRAGIPIFWPIPTGRRMWRMVGLPDTISIEAGSKFETKVLLPAFYVISVIAGAGMLLPALLKRFNITA